MKVICFMPTMPGREAFLERAKDSFDAQVYPADWDVRLVTDAHPTDSLGKKINRACETNEWDYMVLTDDDDYHSPTRVHRQLEPMLPCYYVFTGTSKIYYHDVRNDRCRLYAGTKTRDQWLGGLAFSREVWEKVRFADKTYGVDADWQRDVRSLSDREHWSWLDLADPTLLIASSHSGNAGGRKDTAGSCWTEVKLDDLGDFPKVGEKV